MTEQTMKPMTESKRYPFITIAYGLAAMLVVFGHSHPLHIEYPGKVVTFLYEWHMPLFFFIAGILIAHTAGRRDSINRWWLKKAKKLLLPYVLLTLVAYVPKVMLGAWMNDDMTFSAWNIVKIIFAPRAGVWGHFWFIPAYLILAYVGAWIVRLMSTVKNSTVLNKAKIQIGGGGIAYWL